MTQTDIERLSRLMLDEFTRVHERLDKFDVRFDKHDEHFIAIAQRFDSIERELRTIHRDLEELQEQTSNVAGFRREIDHALERIAAIEKHLGIKRKIAA